MAGFTIHGIVDNAESTNCVVQAKFAPLENKEIVLLEEKTNERKLEPLLFCTVSFAGAIMSVSCYLLVRYKE